MKKNTLAGLALLAAAAAGSFYVSKQHERQPAPQPAPQPVQYRIAVARGVVVDSKPILDTSVTPMIYDDRPLRDVAHCYFTIEEQDGARVEFEHHVIGRHDGSGITCYEPGMKVTVSYDAKDTQERASGKKTAEEATHKLIPTINVKVEE